MSVPSADELRLQLEDNRRRLAELREARAFQSSILQRQAAEIAEENRRNSAPALAAHSRSFTAISRSPAATPPPASSMESGTTTEKRRASNESIAAPAAQASTVRPTNDTAAPAANTSATGEVYSGFSFSGLAMQKTMGASSTFAGTVRDANAQQGANPAANRAVQATEQRLASVVGHTERSSVQEWALDVKGAVVTEEAADRVALLNAFIHGAVVKGQWSELKRLRGEYEDDAALSNATSKRITSLLREHRESTGAQIDAADLAEEDVSAEGGVRLGEEVALRMLKQYKHDRDYAEGHLRQQMKQQQLVTEQLERDIVDQQGATHAAVAEVEKLKGELVQTLQVHEDRLKATKIARDRLTAMEGEKAFLLKSLGEAEVQLSEMAKQAMDAAREREGRDEALAARIRESEAEAFKEVRKENEILREHLDRERHRNQGRKDKYKTQMAAMKSAYNECVAARSKLNSELVELQHVRIAADGRVAAEMARIKESGAREHVDLRRRVSELERVVVEKDRIIAFLKEENSRVVPALPEAAVASTTALSPVNRADSSSPSKDDRSPGADSTLLGMLRRGIGTSPKA